MYTLKAIILPTGTTSTSENMAYFCPCCKFAVLPYGLTSTASTNQAFGNNYSLIAAPIPSTVTYLRSGMFSGCVNIKNAYIPNATTSCVIQQMHQNGYGLEYAYFDHGFTNGPFSNCANIKRVDFSRNVAEIASSSFTSLRSCEIYDFTDCQSIPVLSNTNAFDNISALCKIVVPDSLYASWKTATNWVALADYIYKASEVTL